MRRWIAFLLARLLKPSDRFQAMHSAVLQRFPGTPWVYGGCWSWYSVSFRLASGVVVYPYLPLVLIDRESVPSDVCEDILRACAVHAVPVVDVSDGDDALMRALDRLEEMVGG